MAHGRLLQAVILRLQRLLEILTKRIPINGVDCLQIATEINIRGFPNAKRIKEGGYKVVEPSVVAIQMGEFPVDLKFGKTGQTSKMTLKVTLIGDKPEFKGVSILISREGTSQMRRVYRK